MQPPSACPCRGFTPCQRILLAVSLSTLWTPPATAQLTIEPVPLDAAEGTDVLLLVHNAPQDLVGYTWYKGKTTNKSREIVSYSMLTNITTQGPAFSGRETLYTNGTLLFMKVTREDTGFYTLETLNTYLRRNSTTGEFRVHAEERTPGLPVGAIAGIVIGVLVLVGVALVAALRCFLLYARTRRCGFQPGLRDHSTPASTPGQGPFANSSSLVPVPGHRADVPIYQELLNPDVNIYCQVNHKVDVAS